MSVILRQVMYQGHKWHDPNSKTAASLLHQQSHILEPIVQESVMEML